MAELLANPIVIGVLIGMPSFFLGYLGYRRSQKADKTTATSDAITQIIDGLNQLVDNLQDDNGVLRAQVDACRDRLETSVAERDELKRTIATMLGGLGIFILILFAAGNMHDKQVTEAHLVERAARGAEQAAKAEVKEQVDAEIGAEVNEQLDRRLLPATPPTQPPTPTDPIDIITVPTTTTLPGPFDLTTTTTAPEPPPPVTTTTIEVPTTVTIPDPPALP